MRANLEQPLSQIDEEAATNYAAYMQAYTADAEAYRRHEPLSYHSLNGAAERARRLTERLALQDPDPAIHSVEARKKATLLAQGVAPKDVNRTTQQMARAADRFNRDKGNLAEAVDDLHVMAQEEQDWREAQPYERAVHAVIEAGNEHYQANQAAYHDLGVIAAHLVGISITVQKPLVLGEQLY